MPLIVAGLFLGQWGFCLVWSVLSAIAILWVCLRNLLSLRFVMNHAFINESLVRLLALLAGLVLLMLPVALYSGTHPEYTGDTVQGHWSTTTLNALYSAAQTICMNLSPADWISDARSLGDFPELLFSVHAFLIIAFTLSIPFAAVFAALDAFYSGVADIRIKLWSWQKAHGREPGEIYVFHGLSPQGAALASSIIETRKDHAPLIIFAGFNDADPNGVDIIVSDLLHRAHGRASILFTSLPTEIVPDKLSKRAVETCAIHYFSITDDGASNLRTSGLLWDIVFEQLWDETWRIWHTTFSKAYPDLGPGDYGRLCQAIAEAIVDRAMGASGAREAGGESTTFSLDPAAFDPLLRMGARSGIHCMYTNPKDVAFLDGILGRNVELIASHLTEECQGHRTEIVAGIRELALRLRELVDLHFASQSEMALQALFEHHPLTEALDAINLAETAADGHASTPALPEQQLTVLIVGCGAYGIDALKTVFWLGRIAGTQLKIVVIDKANVAEKMERLYLNCPGLMTERTYSEDGLGPRKGAWSITTRHNTPTVRFVEADVFGSEMRALLAGRKVHTRYYTDDATPAIAEGFEAVLDDNDHLYCLVCLDDEGHGLDAAFDLQRDLAERKMRAWREDDATAPVAGRSDSLVPIAVRVSNDYTPTAEALGESGPQRGLRDYGFPLYTFGSLTDTFSLGFMSSGRLRIQAIQVCAIDSLAHHERLTFRKAEMDYHGLDELSRCQLRSFALPIPHKLWTLGVKPGEIDAEGFQHLLRPATDGQAYEDYEATKGHVDQLFWNGLGITDEQASLDQGERTQGATGSFSVKKDREFRSRWPLLSYLGDLEHVRWRAFMRTLGWRDTLALIEGSDQAASSTERLEQIQQRLPFLEGVANTDLRLHYFLCDDLDELARRGQDCGQNPFSFGRLVLWHSIEILNGTISEGPRESWESD